MTSKKTTRRALFSSFMALLLCCSMLVGTTFAWFTDSVTSTGNIIKSGTLDVEMTWSNDNSTDWKDAATGAIFDYQLWEPGYTDVKYVNIKNVGDLAFKYQLNIIPAVKAVAGQANLADVIDVYVTPVTSGNTIARENLATMTYAGTLTQLINDPDGAAYGTMLPTGATATAPEQVVGELTYCIALKMQESAGNEYQNLSVGDGFSVHLLATQITYEKDSFGPDYDTQAKWPVSGMGTFRMADLAANATSFEMNIKEASDKSNNDNVKVMTATVPVAAVADDAEAFSLQIEEKLDVDSNVTVNSDQGARTFEITATGLAAGNIEAIKVGLYIGTGVNNPVLYHNDVLIPSTYDADGWLTFETTSFSPFTVVYDREAGEAVEPDDTGLPQAVVTEAPQYVGTEIQWGSFGAQWSPTYPDQQLEAAYIFKAPHTSENINECAYKDWHCDYYVKLDRDLGANQIFLGGNYGSFGWVGFDNKDFTLKANTEFPLLGSVAQNPWSYSDIANFVGEFVCGVAQLKGSDALSGATFTVMLRLTNPENPAEFYNVATVPYTFQ